MQTNTRRWHRIILRLYIVSETKHELTSGLFVSLWACSCPIGLEHLRIIDNRLFVENIHPGAWIELDEVDTDIGAGTHHAHIFNSEKSK